MAGMVKLPPAFLLPALANRGRKKTRGFEQVLPSFYKVEHRAMSRAREKTHVLRNGLNAAPFPQIIRIIGSDKRFYGVPGQNI